jgi:hypothetical protein
MIGTYNWNTMSEFNKDTEFQLQYMFHYVLEVSSSLQNHLDIKKNKTKQSSFHSIVRKLWKLR